MCMSILMHLRVKCVLVFLCFSCYVFSLFFHPPLSLFSLWNYSSFLLLAVLTLYVPEHIFINIHLTIYLNLDFMCKIKYTMFFCWVWLILVNMVISSSIHDSCKWYDIILSHGWIKLCWVYVLCFSFPFICWWTARLVPQCSNKMKMQVSLSYNSLDTHTFTY